MLFFLSLTLAHFCHPSWKVAVIHVALIGCENKEKKTQYPVYEAGLSIESINSKEQLAS